MRRIRYLTNTMLANPFEEMNPRLCLMASAPPVPEGAGNNQPANNDPNPQGNQPANNTGQEFDPASFWEDPSPDETKAPSNGVSAAKESAGDGSPNQDQGLGGAIQEQVKNFQAPEIMTKDAIAKIGEGDYSEFNQNMNKAMQGVMEQTIGMNVKIIQAVASQLMQHVETKIQSSFTSKDNYTALRDAIPSAKSPAVAPMVESIYDRALTMTKGDPTKAIAMTKQMLRAMAEGTGKDLDLNVAPSSPDSDGMVPTPKTNWLEALNLPG